jgi:hypothetical protein
LRAEAERRLRAAPNLSKQFNAILPVQSLLKKYFRFLPTQITSLIAAVSSHLEGRLAIVTDAGRDAVDADGALTNALEADGEAVWS